MGCVHLSSGQRSPDIFAIETTRFPGYFMDAFGSVFGSNGKYDNLRFAFSAWQSAPKRG